MSKKIMHSEGYVLIEASNHPACDGRGYVYEHRLVVEKNIGRNLSGKEIVHHINGNKKDNRLKNLLLFKDAKEHLRIHKGWKKINNIWYKRCSSCKRLLEVSEKNYCIRKSGRKKDTPFYLCKKCVSYKDKVFRLVNKKKKTKFLYQYDKNGVFLKKWNTITEAAEKLGLKITSISNCVCENCHTSGGYKWKWKIIKED